MEFVVEATIFRHNRALVSEVQIQEVIAVAPLSPRRNGNVFYLGAGPVMIKIGLYSEDRTLHTLLSSALGKEFEILLQADEDGMNLLRAAGDCDVMILDLHSNHDSLQERIGCTQRLISTHIPSVIMADDGLRSTAFELVRSGAFGYCRRPPSIRDLKTMLSRAYENSTLKHQLETVQSQLDVPVSCDRLIGSSPQMQRDYQLIHRVTNRTA